MTRSRCSLRCPCPGRNRRGRIRRSRLQTLRLYLEICHRRPRYGESRSNTSGNFLLPVLRSHNCKRIDRQNTSPRVHTAWLRTDPQRNWLRASQMRTRTGTPRRRTRRRHCSDTERSRTHRSTRRKALLQSRHCTDRQTDPRAAPTM